MAVKRTFSAPIEQAGDSGGAYVTIPFDVEQVFGSKRVAVRATIDDVAYRGSLVRMGGTCHVLGILKEIRDRIGKGPGDVVEVTVEEDVAPRQVQVPADLAEAFSAAPEARRAFHDLSYTRQREFVGWIEDAKREATRVKRVQRAVELLERGEKTVRPARTSQ